ncbi:MAG: hypothetical protein HY736_15355 [Verrucomicrobia bacterium]|nr:hypothetical protein [Verrucomicrobiota bacterium]
MKPDIIRANLNGPGPFVICTSDGKEYKVPHMDFLFVGRHNLAFENARGGVVIIDPAHVVAISPAPAPRG